MPWSQQKCSMDINYLELLAATLAVKTFAKAKTAMSILLRIDNTTAVAYINNLGGTASKELVIITRDLWMWCLERDIHIAEVHLPGVLNAVAHTESRQMLDRTDWRLNPVIRIPENQQPFWAPGHGPVCIQTVHPVPTLLQLAARSLCIGNECISSGLDSHEVLRKSSMESGGPGSCTSAITTSSNGASSSCLEDRTWFLMLLNMLIDHPWFIIPSLRMPVSVDPMPLLSQLAVWHISGISFKVKTFQKKLPHSSSNYRGLKQTSHMTHSLPNGTAGVLNGVSIHFLDP